MTTQECNQGQTRTMSQFLQLGGDTVGADRTLLTRTNAAHRASLDFEPVPGQLGNSRNRLDTSINQ